MMKLIPRGTVEEMTNDSRAETYRKEATGVLPPHIKVGRKSLWIEHEIQTIIAARVSGQSDTEIRSLVAELVAERASVLERVRQQSSTLRVGHTA
jgi:prophage regulatory protein